MKHIIAFAGSNSSESINKQLATYAAGLVDEVETTILDLNDFELPLFGVDLEKKIGIPENAHNFLNQIRNADGIILSLAEHNGAYSTAFKNLFDWMSRAEQKTFMGKPMLLMAASPGGRGGASVLAIAKDRFPRHNAEIVATFSLPNFKENFNEGKVTNSSLNSELLEAVNAFHDAIFKSELKGTKTDI
ncbi:NAD(P)H-dependent oxidoreductase [Gelidibacter salicanalis]|uniref:NAD(P)H-dependent oxidoreductase n=1 Tax=Gelidibacter salicanalis TaxID=291193 RepID=A0A5C7AS59_9FLAO|nr:NAD(P)H-dependent oxidoreductase [Gelidibacter salicanalis]TXE10864.1 NAD(P)H-dependent oxidoreductase [Gelidibacter salicanalis]